MPDVRGLTTGDARLPAHQWRNPRYVALEQELQYVASHFPGVAARFMHAYTHSPAGPVEGLRMLRDMHAVAGRERLRALVEKEVGPLCQLAD
jgi:hypothetical protein